MPRKTFHSGGPNAEDKALEVWSDVIIDKLEHLSKDAKGEQPWFDKEGLTWPKNMSGRQYSGMNAVILKMLAEKNHYQLPIWGTFNRLTSLNYEKDGDKIVPAHDKDGTDLPRVMVNKGEKSTPVGLTVFTVINKETKEKIPYEDYRELDPEQQQEYNVYPKLAMYNVFNLIQTNLKEARPELYEKLKAMCDQEEPQKDRKMWTLPEFDAMLDEQKWICPIDIKDEGKYYYCINRDRIQMVPKEKFKNGEAFYTNSFHEMSHSTTSVTHRIDTQNFGSDKYAAEELHAELSAALVASKYGATKNLKTDTLPYVKSWLEQLHENPKFIKTMLGDVKKSSNMILEHLNNMKLELEQRAEQTEAKTEKKVVAKGTSLFDSALGKPEQKGKLQDLGTYDVPEWALNYLENGYASGLTDKEQNIVDKFVKENFPKGFTMNVDFGNVNEFNRYPAFGERNESALTNRGEAPFLATKTVSAKFIGEKLDLAEEQTASKSVSQDNDQQQDQQEEEAPRRGFHR